MFVYVLLLSSCNSQLKDKHSNASKNVLVKNSTSTKTQESDKTLGPSLLLQQPISPFVRRIFQDKNNNLWFGTNGDGVLIYTMENP